jgi:hypothetical protein
MCWSDEIGGRQFDERVAAKESEGRGTSRALHALLGIGGRRAPYPSKLDPLFVLAALGHAGFIVVAYAAAPAERLMRIFLVQRIALLDRERPRVELAIGPLSVRGLHEGRPGDESAEGKRGHEDFHTWSP